MTQRGWWSVVWATAGVQLLGAVLVSEASAKNCQTVADSGGPPALCELTTYQTCAGRDTACPAGSACGDKPTLDNQAECALYAEGICRQPYELSCKRDADCGTGFRCTEQIGRACSGMATSGGNGVPPSWHEDCRETRGTFHCELVRTLRGRPRLRSGSPLLAERAVAVRLPERDHGRGRACGAGIVRSGLSGGPDALRA